MARRARPHFMRLVDRIEVDRNEAIKLILTGQVMINGIVARNPRTLVARDAAVTVTVPEERTLRGTIKLRAALARFDADVAGQTCLDLGAAAGGFTTALLEAGAARVYAVDTGYGQLPGRLRQHQRVVNLERTNLRDLRPSGLAEPIGLVCLDLSYLALASAMPQLAGIRWTHRADLIALVKPTFELGSGSLLADDESVAKAEAAASAAAESCGWSILASMPAPTTGQAGAQEVFIHARRSERPI